MADLPNGLYVMVDRQNGENQECATAFHRPTLPYVSIIDAIRANLPLPVWRLQQRSGRDARTPDMTVEDTLKVPGGCANVTIVSPIFDLRHQHIAIDHA